MLICYLFMEKEVIISPTPKSPRKQPKNMLVYTCYYHPWVGCSPQPLATTILATGKVLDKWYKTRLDGQF
ncbi:hypothetical protein Lbru_2536 [Legionella brunensis]|uniref:Uncharacterized protein n=1 Tax=Legionella brunensis TaxID=29422 RepID=A0A0W0S5A6_9GAMM|nr:hypothetical protein Lbru_2536 [Legionella brunensis]